MWPDCACPPIHCCRANAHPRESKRRSAEAPISTSSIAAPIWSMQIVCIQRQRRAQTPVTQLQLAAIGKAASAIISSICRISFIKAVAGAQFAYPQGVGISSAGLPVLTLGRSPVAARVSGDHDHRGRIQPCKSLATTPKAGPAVSQHFVQPDSSQGQLPNKFLPLTGNPGAIPAMLGRRNKQAAQ